MVGAEVTSYLLDVQPGLYKVLASTVGEDTTRYLHGPLGMQSQQSPQGAWVFPVTDGLGSVRGVVSDGLSQLESRQYEPYGEPFGATGADQTPFGFTGEWTDDNDLLYLRARYLDTEMGRFFQIDSLEGSTNRPQTLNAYVYALGNPAFYTDPSGRVSSSGPLPFGYSSWEVVLAILVVLGAVSLAAPGAAAGAITIGPLLIAALVGVVIYLIFINPGLADLIGQLIRALAERAWYEVTKLTEQLSWVTAQSGSCAVPITGGIRGEITPSNVLPEACYKREDKDKENASIFRASRTGIATIDDVALYRAIDWDTALSFFEEPIPGVQNIVYIESTLKTNNFFVNHDKSPKGHVSVRYLDDTAWNDWFFWESKRLKDIQPPGTSIQSDVSGPPHWLTEKLWNLKIGFN